MSSLFWGVRQCWLRFSYLRFGTVYRSYLQGSNSPRRMPRTVHCVVFFSWLLHPPLPAPLLISHAVAASCSSSVFPHSSLGSYPSSFPLLRPFLFLQSSGGTLATIPAPQRLVLQASINSNGLFHFLWGLKMGLTACPETSVTTNQSCVTSQNSKDVI